MKRENFYRRDPGRALSGMAGMSLEERGVYNTIIDLLYLTWRPLEDNSAYIAGHCGCAVQKLNPILRRLIEKGKLVRFEEGGQTYISNGHFEDERTAVKGVTTRSGRGKVEEKSAGVEEKSAGVEKNPALLDHDVEEKQRLAPLEKSRQDKTTPPNPPLGGQLALVPTEEGFDEPRQAFDLWNVTAKRCGLPQALDLTDRRRSAIRKRLASGGIDGWLAALKAVEVSALCMGQKPGRDGGDPFRADLDFVCQAKSYQRLREGSYGRDAKPVPAPPGPPDDPQAVWRQRVDRALNGSGSWDTMDWGSRPGKSGCLAPATILLEFGITPAEAGEILPFPVNSNRSAA